MQFSALDKNYTPLNYFFISLKPKLDFTVKKKLEKNRQISIIFPLRGAIFGNCLSDFDDFFCKLQKISLSFHITKVLKNSNFFKKIYGNPVPDYFRVYCHKLDSFGFFSHLTVELFIHCIRKYFRT